MLLSLGGIPDGFSFYIFLNKIAYIFIIEKLELQKGTKQREKSLINILPRDKYY